MTILISFFKKYITQQILLELLKTTVGRAVIESLLLKIQKEANESENKIDDAVVEVLIDTVHKILGDEQK